MATSPILCPNALICPIHNDGLTPADRVAFGYQCQQNNQHWADATVLAWTTSTPPTYQAFSDIPVQGSF